MRISNLKIRKEGIDYTLEEINIANNFLHLTIYINWNLDKKRVPRLLVK
jgi:hypothetical protein